MSVIASTRCPLPMPAGWYQVLYSNELGSGEATPLRYFATDLVAFRTEDGVAQVLDAYCPHMGAHLGYGIRDQAGHAARVVGDSIECPFHGWRYNGAGQCTHVPYAKNLPPRVERGEQVIRSWPVREINQTILVWYHPNGAEPDYEPELIPEAEANNPDWSTAHIHQWELNTHMQEIGENAVDAAHFIYVHGVDEYPEPAELAFEGPIRHGLFHTKQPTPRGIIDGSIANRSVGPGLSRVKFTGIYDTVLMANITPIEPELSRAFYAFIQPTATADTLGKTVGKAIVANICQQMEEDRIIWDRKRYLERPLLCDGDGPIAKFRRWYNQFLVEKESA
jgi:3-ketosteroid 9alpha-monooxygenase subunit A